MADPIAVFVMPAVIAAASGDASCKTRAPTSGRAQES